MRHGLLLASLILLPGCLKELPAAERGQGEGPALHDVHLSSDNALSGDEDLQDLEVQEARRGDTSPSTDHGERERTRREDTLTTPRDTTQGANDVQSQEVDSLGPTLPEPEDLALTIWSPIEAIATAAIPVLIDAPREFSGPVDVNVLGQSRTVLVHRGRGSFSLALPEGEGHVVALAPPFQSELSLNDVERPIRSLQGELMGQDLIWDNASDIEVMATVSVLPGHTLKVEPGTRVFVHDKVRLEVLGELEVVGPALFTKASEHAWGGVVVKSGASASITDAWFIGGGGDSSKSFGHSASQPVLKASSASLVMSGGGILDSPGKALGGYKANITLDTVLIARCDTGGEFIQSTFMGSHLHILEIPDADGVLEDDDNDGFYFTGVPADSAAQGSTLNDVVFSLGEDDAIDHNDAILTVNKAWIQDFAHEGIAASGGRSVEVSNTVIMNCDQGIEAGYGSPEVHVTTSLLTNNRIGIRFGDAYDWSDNGTLHVTHTVAVDNNEANVLNLTDKGTAKAGAISIQCSMVNESSFNGRHGNMAGNPVWDPLSGCVDAPLCEGSPLGPDTCAP